LFSMCTKRGMLTWYIEIATAFSLRTGGTGKHSASRGG
jgi:hypothetical protein